MPTLGTLFNNSRLIAKTLNRIIVEPDNVEINDWRNEGKLLQSPGGSCLSSTTLLIPGKHVPTYGYDGRGYGMLFDAEQTYIYDVNPRDANTNRTDKLQKRNARKNIDMLTDNDQNLLTLDKLSKKIKAGEDGEMNEVLLDAWQKSLVGIFVKKIDTATAGRDALKNYYLNLLEAKLANKYFTQAMGFTPLQICLYAEREGRLIKFPTDQELNALANMVGVNSSTYPKLYSLLADEYVFSKLPQPVTLGQYFENYQPAEELAMVQTEVVQALLKKFEPFDARPVNETTIFNEPVDSIIGISQMSIDETINSCIAAMKAKSNLSTPVTNPTSIADQKNRFLYRPAGLEDKMNGDDALKTQSFIKK